MINNTSIIDRLLDNLKKVLVRFRDAKFGVLFIVNAFKIPTFLADKRVHILNKFKVIFSLITLTAYFISGIDVIPELLLGIFGLADDMFVVIWCLGIINEEIEKYKSMISKNEKIIKDVHYTIRDDE